MLLAKMRYVNHQSCPVSLFTVLKKTKLTFLEIFPLFACHVSGRFFCDQLSTKDDVPFLSVLLSIANHQKNQKVTLKLVIDTKPAFIIQSFTSIPKEFIS